MENAETREERDSEAMSLILLTSRKPFLQSPTTSVFLTLVALTLNEPLPDSTLVPLQWHR